MKKVIVASIIFGIVLGFAVWEIVFSTRLFMDLYDGLDKVQESIYASGENIDNAETLQLMDDITTRWKGGRNMVFCLGNHNVLRALDDKIVSLDIMIKINHIDDAKVLVESTRNLIKAVMNDTHPVPTNLF